MGTYTRINRWRAHESGNSILRCSQILFHTVRTLLHSLYVGIKLLTNEHTPHPQCDQSQFPVLPCVLHAASCQRTSIWGTALDEPNWSKIARGGLFDRVVHHRRVCRHRTEPFFCMGVSVQRSLLSGEATNKPSLPQRQRKTRKTQNKERATPALPGSWAKIQ